GALGSGMPGLPEVRGSPLTVPVPLPLFSASVLSAPPATFARSLSSILRCSAISCLLFLLWALSARNDRTVPHREPVGPQKNRRAASSDSYRNGNSSNSLSRSVCSPASSPCLLATFSHAVVGVS